jgi:hypothetical protein
MTSGEPIRIWPVLTASATLLAVLILIVLVTGSFLALAAIALAPAAVLVLWFAIRGQWLRRQIDALPRYLTSRRVHVLLADANEMQSALDRLRISWGWTWNKEAAFHANMANLAPKVARARATGLFALRTRRPERFPKARLQDTLRVHRDLRRHLILSLAQEVEIREQKHGRDLAALRARGLCTFDAGAGLSREVRWLDVNARIKRIRDEEILALTEAASALQNAPGEARQILGQAQERQRAGDLSGAIETLLQLRIKPTDLPPQTIASQRPPVGPAPSVPPPAAPSVPPPAAPGPVRRQRRKGEEL